MLIIKIISSLIIIIFSFIIGFIKSYDLIKRPKQIRELRILLKILENEILFLSNTIKDSFINLDKSTKSNIAIFFKDTIKNLSKNPNLQNAWELSIRENIKKTSLNKEVENILISFGKILGSTDTDGQLKNIGFAVEQLKIQEEIAQEDRKKNESLYRNLGLLGGFLIVILCF